MRTLTSRRNASSRSERGIALVVALMAMLLLTALGMALMLTTTTETMIAANYRDGIEGMYSADAGIERTMQDLLTVPDWNNVLASDDGVRARLTSGFADDTLTPTLGDGRLLDLRKATASVNCPQVSPTPTSCTDGQMNQSTAERPWGSNNPRWRIYAWGPVSNFLPTGTINSPFYIVVWVADDTSPSTRGVDDTVAAVDRAFADPRHGSTSRQAVVEELFYKPGTATARAVGELYDVLELEAPDAVKQWVPRPAFEGQPVPAARAGGTR
jgi:Tfp pilus assembly protein PilX